MSTGFFEKTTAGYKNLFLTTYLDNPVDFLLKNVYNVNEFNESTIYYGEHR